MLRDNLLTIFLLGLIILVLALLGFVVWASLRQQKRLDKPNEQKPERLDVESLKQSFRRAVELIEANIVSGAERYNIPWVLVLNDGQGAAGLPLVQSGLHTGLSADSILSAAAQGITWNFFDKGVVVQFRVEYLGSPDGENDGNRIWDEFLSLCEAYRPERPFDSVVLSLPASMMGRDDPKALLDVAEYAKSIHRRLWRTQISLAMRFPVYTVVAGCEAIPGFARMASVLPEGLRNSMLGWSSPFDLSAPYQSAWVDSAVNAVTVSLSDACQELSSLELPGNDSADYFLLPLQIESLRASLKVFCDELMKPSSYHEPFMFRGIYLTGDCSFSAQLFARRLGEEASDAMVSQAAIAGTTSSTTSSADPQTTKPDSPLVEAAQNPAFLRQIFESKVFEESGLARPTQIQRMRRPLLSKTTRWVAVGLLLFWALGLAFATIRMDKQFRLIADVLQRLDLDAKSGASGGVGGKATALVEAGDYQDPAKVRSMQDIAALTALSQVHINSIFMPGSWSWFDDLGDRLEVMTASRFAQNALIPIRRAVHQQISQLTGVPVDPSTGNLIKGAMCSLPPNWASQTLDRSGVPSLSVNRTPEFGAALQYLANIDQIDQVIGAMTRLVDGDAPPSGNDLRLIVKAIAGVDPKLDMKRQAEIFRRYAKSASESAPLEPMQAAAGCTFKLAIKELDKRLFDENELLLSEKRIADLTTKLVTGGVGSVDPVKAIDGWKAIQDELYRQEDLFDPGQGYWINRRSFDANKGYSDLMQSAASMSLIGPAVAAQVKSTTNERLGEFLNDWDATLRTSRSAIGKGLAWSDKENKWAFAEDRVSLLTGLTELLLQPYTNVVIRRNQLVAPGQQTISWDKIKLDQALAMSTTRKDFYINILPKFPAVARAEIDQLTNGLLANVVTDLTAQSMILNQPGVRPPPLDDAVRTRLSGLQSMLIDMGAKTSSDQITAVLAMDAQVRLRLLDDAFQRSDVYVPQDRSFKNWTGDKAPLQQAFSVSDSQGVAAYVADQSAYVDALSREADNLLPRLDSTYTSSPVAVRWQGIVNDLSRYRLKSPNSSLMLLEQFVLVTAADVDRANCAEKLITKSVARGSSDVFSERQQMLLSGLANRCRDLVSTERRDAWDSFAQRFNQDLAGRSPFMFLSNAQSWAAPGVVAGQVRNAEITAVDSDTAGMTLRLFDSAHKLLNDRSASRPGSTNPGVPVMRFDLQMDRVRNFMAPLYPTDESQPAGYDLSVEFRSNVAFEVDGNQIAEWTLTVGNQTLRQREPARVLRWQPGMPVVLALRLARDGPLVPTVDSAQPWMSIDNRTASYRFTDPWALYSFISRHRDIETAPRSDTKSQLLRFELPLGSPSDNLTEVPAVASRARVFMRLTITGAGKRAPLVWPVIFPTTAPVWGIQ
jgi:type VI secretion system protein ImpL